ncbi:MAG: 2-C-methyl-D-erythritol 4-phosphate cytidylyltransferase [Mollicutes bacterium]|jgi:2-C-methyl-D-erythritol 4-phosphate cytidylyltransferase|nr:2-C-methyl-D-erythritol 4-phosphate cytidylyltransferase [Mollicutes bacterium]
MNIALITAGGIGSRTNQCVPKQFLTVYNKPVIVYTLEAFQNHPNIDVIMVSCLKGWEPILRAYAEQYNITKLKWIVPSARTSQESIKRCLKVLEKNCQPTDFILVHDGNRPLVSTDIISDSIVTCMEKGGAVAVIPCTEVIVKTTDQSTSVEVIDRDSLKRTQTPHTYPLEKLLWAHREAENRNITNSIATCDLMIKLGEKIYFSHGSEKNLKITTKADVEIFKALLNATDDDDGFKK